jgi:hypothetical protein
MMQVFYFPCGRIMARSIVRVKAQHRTHFFTCMVKERSHGVLRCYDYVRAVRDDIFCLALTSG